MAEHAAPDRVVLSFGRFQLVPGERLLTADGMPVALGARTLDTLIALASRPNEVIGKRALMATVWPDVFVEEGSLRFHIATLRRALGDGQDGARFISTLAGRGYCFVAPVTRVDVPAPAGPAADGFAATAAADVVANLLPDRLIRMIGRDDEIRLLCTQLATSRFVTIVGPGGVGKTTVAVAIAHDVRTAFSGAVWFVDLGLLSDDRMVAAAVAALLGLSIPSDDATSGVTAFLRDKQVLLVLDCCEHVIEGAARLAESIFMAAPKISILATSREALRVEGEWVHRLAPLALPPDAAGLNAARALDYPATRLFVDRAMANGALLDFNDRDAVIVGSICRRLDGVALAIELAAGRVSAYGLEQTAALLEQRLALQWPGKRTAPPRQKSLHATLDWSYGLLSDLERAVLRRLTAFVGPFSLDAAQAVAEDSSIDRVQVLGALESLVAKSMVATQALGTTLRYRLLDTTHAYLVEMGIDDAERGGFAARHAGYYQRWLEKIAAEWPGFSNPAATAAHLGNIRAALEWSFGDTGDRHIAIGLAVAATPVLLAMSLLTECRHWSERALLVLGEFEPEGHAAMRAQATYGLSAMWTRGNSDVAYAALHRSIAIAQARGDTVSQILLFGPLHVFRLRAGEFSTALNYAEHVAGLANSVEDPAAIALSRILLGFSWHLAGRLDDARVELEAGLAHGASHDAGSGLLATDALAAPILALASAAAAGALSRTLWLQGRSADAARRVELTIADPSLVDHPVNFLASLHWAISVLLWAEDFDTAEKQIARFMSYAETYSLKPQMIMGRGFRGELAIGRGEIAAGATLLQASLHELHALRYELLTTGFHLALARAFTALGRCHEGIALIDRTIGAVEVNGDLSYMPELLRVKAGLLLAAAPSRGDEAQACLTASLAWSRRQGAGAWELRTAVDLGGLWASQGRSADARALLQPVLARLAAAGDSADLRAAERLLAACGDAEG